MPGEGGSEGTVLMVSLQCPNPSTWVARGQTKPPSLVLRLLEFVLALRVKMPHLPVIWTVSSGYSSIIPVHLSMQFISIMRYIMRILIGFQSNGKHEYGKELAEMKIPSATQSIVLNPSNYCSTAMFFCQSTIGSRLSSFRSPSH